MKNKIFAVLLLVINVLMILYAIQLFYFYNFTDVSFAFVLPIWLLILYLLVGGWGVFVDRKLYKSTIKIKTALFQDLVPKIALLALEYVVF